MAKVSLNKVAPVKNIDPKVINICGEEITVIQYLPMADKITFVENILAEVFDSTGLSSPIRTEVHFYLNLIKTYTSISITDKMMENAAKTYDLLEMNHIVETVIENIPEDEFEALFDYVSDTIEHLETYNTSMAGMMKAITQDYQSTQLDVQAIAQDLAKVENSETLQQVLANLN